MRKSLVLLKNERNALPIAATAKRIHVAGKSADDIGNQCGGWTIQWQGESGPVTQGTTVLGAIRQHVKVASKVTYSVDGTGAEGADVAVVVVGETPYAEMMGDRRDLSLAKEDVQAIANAKKSGVPVVVILFSGPSAAARRRAGQCRRVHRRMAAWHGGRWDCGRALRRLQANRQTASELAEVGGADSDQRGGRQLRPAVSVWVRADVLIRDRSHIAAPSWRPDGQMTWWTSVRLWQQDRRIVRTRSGTPWASASRQEGDHGAARR